MYLHVAFLIILSASVESATYADRFSTYSSTSYPYNNQYNTGSYSSDVANYPATRYPNYSPGYSTNKYDTYTTPRSNVFYPPEGYTTPRYGSGYGNAGSGYGNAGSDYGNAGSGNNYGNVNSYGQGNYGQNYGQGYGNSYKSGYSSYEQPFMNNIRDYCVNRSPQTGIWVDNLMGMWYGVEFIQHLAGDSRVDYARTCIVVHISEPMDQPSTENQLFHVQHINARFRQEYRHLRLLWDEAGSTIEYSLYFKNDSAGYWQVFNPQNGTLPSLHRYHQFSGTIQVLKAVNDHLVLNFCQDALNGRTAQLYSILLTREPGYMERWELESVHNLLQTKQLSIASRRMVCGNGADKPLYSIVSSIILVLLTFAMRSF